MVNLLVMDAYNISRNALCSFIEEHQEIHVMGNAADMTGVMKICNQSTLIPDILLFNSRSKAASSTTKEIQRILPRIKVLILVSALPEYNVAQVFVEGIDAIIHEQSDPDLLFVAIQELTQGKKFLDPSIAKFELVAQVARDTQHTLTVRQREVLVCLAQGYSNHEIAEHLCISTETVKSHVHTIRMKLGAVSRVNAALIAWKNGFADEAG